MGPEDHLESAKPEPKRESRGEKILEEKNFIYEEKGKNPIPLWFFIAIVLGIFTILWGAGNWVLQEMKTKVEENPFLQVTNREMSVFLWQNPEFMRIHSSNKTGYLPGFYSIGKVNPKPENINEFVVAPPEVIFGYHTWKRLLSEYVIPRQIPREEFKEFLASSPEWKPENWAKAPEEYKQFVDEFDLVSVPNLQSLPIQTLPKNVRNAYLGWKNYYREGDLINQEKPSVGEMREFLDRYPNYSRHNWRNLYPLYLQTLQDQSTDPETIIPNEELTSFLRAAYYNDKQLKNE